MASAGGAICNHRTGRGAIAATSTSNYADTHTAMTATSTVALDHGFKTGLDVLTGLLVLGALIAVTLVRTRGPRPQAAPVEQETFALKEAA